MKRLLRGATTVALVIAATGLQMPDSYAAGSACGQGVYTSYSGGAFSHNACTVQSYDGADVQSYLKVSFQGTPTRYGACTTRVVLRNASRSVPDVDRNVDCFSATQQPGTTYAIGYTVGLDYLILSNGYQSGDRAFTLGYLCVFFDGVQRCSSGQASSPTVPITVQYT